MIEHVSSHSLPSRQAATKRLAMWLAIASIVLPGLSSRAFAQVPVSTPAMALQEVRRLFQIAEADSALPLLEQAIKQLTGSRRPEDVDLLLEAFRLKAHASWLLNDQDAARAAFEELLKTAPGHTLPEGSETPARLRALFDSLAANMVGQLALTVTPDDAEVQLDSVVLAQRGSQVLKLVAGEHMLNIRRAGHEPLVQPVTITPGGIVAITLTLARTSAMLRFFTVPPDVEVLVDGRSYGVTHTSAAIGQFNAWLDEAKVSPDKVGMLEVELPPGDRTFEYRKSCHESHLDKRLVEKPADYNVGPVTLKRAIGTIQIDSAASDQRVFVNGDEKGPPPLTLELCKGRYSVEVRSPLGRSIDQLDVETDGKYPIQPRLRPTFAILSVSLFPSTFRSGSDLREEVQRVLNRAATVGFYVPPTTEVDAARQTEKLEADWLSFDRTRNPLTDAARNIVPAGRIAFSERLSRRLDVQGVAAITKASDTDFRRVFVTLLSAGSGEPDVLEVKLDEPKSIELALEKLGPNPAFWRPTAGLLLIDVVGRPGAVVAHVDAGGLAASAGLVAGDVITHVKGEPISSAVAFEELLAKAKINDSLPVQARDASNAAKQAVLRIGATPATISLKDQTLLFNKSVVELRLRRTTAAPADEPVARLNLAIALMRVRNWASALDELKHVTLPKGPGVSNGTVQYLLGLCYRELGQAAEADTAWQAALASEESLLTEDGPPIKDLIEKELKGRPARPGL